MSRHRSIGQVASIFAGKLPQEPDWIGIVEIANQELITAELFDRLRQFDMLDAIPEDLRSFLEDVRNRTADRMKRLSDTLHEALTALNEASITPMLLKGSGLIAEFDPRDTGPGKVRIVSDLDLLIRPTELSAAMSALQKCGFAVVEDNSLDSFHDAVVLTRPTDVGAIDLHQNAPGPRGVMDLDDLYARSRLTAFRGAAARIPAPEDQILLLVMHDQFQDGHFWRGGFNFRHLVDIARLSAAPRQVEWTTLATMRQPSILKMAVAAQLAAARSLAGASVPSNMPGRRWGRIHYWRQRMQLTWPLFNRPFNKAGISSNVWRNLSARWLAPR